jgi:hypothetical protein
VRALRTGYRCPVSGIRRRGRKVSRLGWGSFLFVGCGVVCAAEELGVGEVGFSCVCPVDDVVCVTP